MTDKKLTDNEIIKALKEILELMCNEGDLQRSATISNALDLINRLQARVEKCEKVEHFADKTIATLQAENERLCQINGTLLSDGSKIFQEIEIVKAENERLEKENKHYAELEQGCYVTGVKNIKAEAYKEFAEKLHEELRIYGIKDKFNKSVFLNVVDKAKKELVGEEK